MTSILNMLADGYMGKECYKEAAENYKKLSVLKREIIDKEEKSTMKELTSVYELKSMELKLQKQMDRERSILISIIALTIVISLCYINYRTIKNSRKIIRKNRLIVKMLDELTLKKQPTQKDKVGATGDKTLTDEERQAFNTIRNELTEKKLFLHADLNRDQLLQKFHIPKNKFSSMFIKYAGMPYSQFINGLRLEYAIDMLKSHPNYTVESIASECGMTTTTFYRLFSKRYGMTPAEYREAVKLNLQNDPQEGETDS